MIGFTTQTPNEAPLNSNYCSSKGYRTLDILMSPSLCLEKQRKSPDRWMSRTYKKKQLSPDPERCSLKEGKKWILVSSMDWVFIYICSSGWSQTSYAGKDNLEILIFLSPPLKW